MGLNYSYADYAIIFLAISIITSRIPQVVLPSWSQLSIKWAMRLSTCMFVTFTTFVLSLQSHPFWVIFLMSLLGYLLVESIYIWIIIRLYSKIDFPLFPHFEHESDTIMWPQGKYAEKIRETFAKLGFKFAETLAIKITSTAIIIAPIFYNPKGDIRLQVLFSNFAKKRTLINFILTSYLRNGTILVTHNLQSTVASFFAEPFKSNFKSTSSIDALLKHHKKIVKKYSKQTFCLSGEDCKQAINNEQILLEKANLANGNCERLDNRTNVTISFVGRYKLWINSLRLNYFGI